MMIHHVSVGVADVEGAGKFYDAVLGALGHKRIFEILPYAICYGEDGYDFWVQLPHDRQAASAGNGLHIAFVARTKNAVHAFHAAALSHGGTDEGQPGPRPDYGPDYYGAFARDPFGNKIEATLKPGAPAKARNSARPTAKAKTKRSKKSAKKIAAKKRPAKRKARRR